MTEISPPVDSPARARALPFAIGVGGGVLGILPWLIGGGILPLQNLWASATMPEDMPFVLLPLSQYFVTLLFSLLLLGGVFAGFTVHFVARRRAIAVWPAALGVLLVHVIAGGAELRRPGRRARARARWRQSSDAVLRRSPRRG